MYLVMEEMEHIMQFSIAPATFPLGCFNIDIGPCFIYIHMNKSTSDS